MDEKKSRLDLRDVTSKMKGVAGEAWKKTVDLSKDVVVNTSAKIQEMKENAQNIDFQRRLEKYCPLFADEYHADDFTFPAMIVITEDDAFPDKEVCNGALGWRNKDNDLIVLYLQYSMAEKSELQFFPAMIRDNVYYVDRFDSKRYVQLDSIFNKAHEERLAELKMIAYSLGAKYFSVEISETSNDTEHSEKHFNLSANAKPLPIHLKADTDRHSDNKKYMQRYGKIEAKFEGSDTPKIPELKWFRSDENIKNLITMRMENSNAIKSETLFLEGTVSATMSQKDACAIDAAVGKFGLKSSGSMAHQATRENYSKLIFRIEF